MDEVPLLSPYDDVQAYVAHRAPDAFEIRVRDDASKSKRSGHKFTCSYRVVAKRADIRGRRLEKVKLSEPQTHGLGAESLAQVGPSVALAGAPGRPNATERDAKRGRSVI